MSQPFDQYPGQPPYGGWPPPPAPAPAPPGAWPPYYGVPAPAPRRRKRAVVAWTVGGSLLAVALLVTIAVGGFRMGSAGLGNAVPDAPTSAPADWAVIGDDAGLDPYAERCHDGAMDACDDLYHLAEPGSDYEYYGLTCGGRVQPRDVALCVLLD